MHPTSTLIVKLMLPVGEQVYVVLRQQYLTGGEELLNKWQSFYLNSNPGPGNNAVAKAFRRNFGTNRLAHMVSSAAHIATKGL